MPIAVRPLRYWVQLALPAVYGNELSYYEVLSKVVDKLNELVDVVGDTATIDEINRAIAEIELEIQQLRQYVDEETLKTKKYSDDQNKVLEARLVELIYRISVGQVVVRSQTTGNVVPIQEEMDRQYDYLRYYAYNAGKQDSFEKTAQEIDAYLATAYKYDLYNATLLNGNNSLPDEDGN